LAREQTEKDEEVRRSCKQKRERNGKGRARMSEEILGKTAGVCRLPKTVLGPGKHNTAGQKRKGTKVKISKVIKQLKDDED
jgi:hypothetical protein